MFDEVAWQIKAMYVKNPAACLVVFHCVALMKVSTEKKHEDCLIKSNYSELACQRCMQINSLTEADGDGVAALRLQFSSKLLELALNC